MKNIIIKFIYMVLLPAMYVVAVVGVLMHNNWTLDAAQIMILIMMGCMIAAAIYVVSFLPSKPVYTEIVIMNIEELQHFKTFAKNEMGEIVVIGDGTFEVKVSKSLSDHFDAKYSDPYTL